MNYFGCGGQGGGIASLEQIYISKWLMASFFCETLWNALE